MDDAYAGVDEEREMGVFCFYFITLKPRVE